MIAKALMVVRDEAEILKTNLVYHLALGFDEICILDHCSVDGTRDLLSGFQGDPRVRIFLEDRPEFDHEAYANVLLGHALAGAGADWIFTLDADEFLSLSKPLHPFLEEMDAREIRYATIKWLNALPVRRASASNGEVSLEWYYEPWPERNWQHEGHFRKAFCRAHHGMSVVVGGHYFRREENRSFFSGEHGCPTELSLREARIYHLEQRLSPKALLSKWMQLGAHVVEPRYDPNAPWNEKLLRMKEYLAHYDGNLEAIAADWFDRRRTFWGNEIPPWRLVRDAALTPWLAPGGNWAGPGE